MNRDNEEIIEEIKRLKESMFVAISVLVILAAIACLEARLPDAIGVFGGIAFVGFLFAGVPVSVACGGAPSWSGSRLFSARFKCASFKFQAQKLRAMLALLFT